MVIGPSCQRLDRVKFGIQNRRRRNSETNRVVTLKLYFSVFVAVSTPIITVIIIIVINVVINVIINVDIVANVVIVVILLIFLHNLISDRL